MLLLLVVRNITVLVLCPYLSLLKIALFLTFSKLTKKFNICHSKTRFSKKKPNKAVLDVDQKTLSLKDLISGQVLALQINTGIARVSQSTSINPKSITYVEVFISNLPNDQSVLLE